MITYKGDKFVTGKYFLKESDNTVLKFITKSKTGFIFEDNKQNKVVMKESDAKELLEYVCKRKV